MPYLIECSEWRLLQTLGLLIGRKKSRFNGDSVHSLDSKPRNSGLPDLTAELFEVEVRRVFLPQDCPRLLSATEFYECEKTLKSLCGLLDRIVHPRVSQAADTKAGYPRLHSLVRLLEHYKSDERVDLASGSQPTLFKPPEDPDELETVLALVTDYNNSLTRLCATPVREAKVRSASKEILRKTWKDLRLRRRATSALGAVFGHLRCGMDHEVMLNVSEAADHSASVPNLNLRLSSCTKSADCPGAQWLEVRCASVDSSWNASVAEIHNICLDLRNHQGQGTALILLIEQYGLFGAWTPLQSSWPASAPPEDNLDQLISSGAFKPLDLLSLSRGSSSRRYKTQEKRALAVRLGYCLMDFFEADLSSKRIYFTGSTTASCPQTKEETLYLAFASVLPATANSYVFQIGHPTLLSFAKLLLEIDFGQIIDLSVSSDYSKTNRGTWAELCHMVDQLEEERNDSYLQAVRGCLMVHQQISGALRRGFADGKNAELAVRKELYEQVVERLETALVESTPRPGKKRQRSESPEPVSRTKSTLDPRGAQRISSADAPDLRASASLLQAPFRPTFKRPRMPNPQEPGSAKPSRLGLSSGVLPPGSSGLFDDSTPNAYSQDVYRLADNFMKQHQIVYQQAIEEDTTRTPAVKVAILDTGLDLTHPHIVASRDRIKDARSWLPPNRTTDGADVSGHGTHVTALLLATAPDCDVYIAQIAEFLPISPDQIAKAVMHAVNEWQVDIITMSFGFLDEKEHGCSELRDAILHAHASRVLMFAAAFNVGAHGTAPAFPARLSNVFCIYSGDGMGNCTRTTPTARRHLYNFLTLGEAVESAWPKALSKEPWLERKSGTSFATPIAAGIAAFLLLYAYQTLPWKDAQKFKEHDKMRDWLFHVSNERGGYNVLSVNSFFENRTPQERRMLMENLLEGRPWKT